MSILKGLREAKLLTQAELSALSGISIQAIASYENGRRHQMRFRTAKALAPHLGIEAGDLRTQLMAETVA